MTKKQINILLKHGDLILDNEVRISKGLTYRPGRNLGIILPFNSVIYKVSDGLIKLMNEAFNIHIDVWIDSGNYDYTLKIDHRCTVMTKEQAIAYLNSEVIKNIENLDKIDLLDYHQSPEIIIANWDHGLEKNDLSQIIKFIKFNLFKGEKITGSLYDKRDELSDLAIDLMFKPFEGIMIVDNIIQYKIIELNIEYLQAKINDLETTVDEYTIPDLGPPINVDLSSNTLKKPCIKSLTVNDLQSYAIGMLCVYKGIKIKNANSVKIGLNSVGYSKDKVPKLFLSRYNQFKDIVIELKHAKLENREKSFSKESKHRWANHRNHHKSALAFLTPEETQTAEDIWQDIESSIRS